LPDLGWIGLATGWPGVVAIVAAWLMSSRRRKIVTVLDKPSHEPRFPKMIDSWSAVVPRLGADHEAVRTRLFEAIRANPIPRMTSSFENYGYSGPDGFLEREQLVVRLGQGIVHVYVYAYEGELFVGWDANLNLVRWAETSVQSSRIEARKLHEFRSLVVSWYTPNEYDVIDVNLIAEVVHRRLKSQLLGVMKERSIDEEIDFSIIRGNRDALVDKKKSDKGPGPGEAGLTGLAAVTRRFTRE
jgi:hypothetical protein